MSPQDLHSLSLALAKLSALCGALGALSVLTGLGVLRVFTDWLVARQQASIRISAARTRAALAHASEGVLGAGTEPATAGRLALHERHNASDGLPQAANQLKKHEVIQ